MWNVRDRLEAEWVPGPQFKIRPPVRGLGALERPRLESALSAAADSHRLTLVAAPAGYGKSTFLGDWVRKCALPCAWLSLRQLKLMSSPQQSFALEPVIRGSACEQPGNPPWHPAYTASIGATDWRTIISHSSLTL